MKKCLVFFTMTLAISLTAKTIYVDAAASGSGNGEKSSPFAKVEDAVKSLRGEKEHSEIIVRPGVYRFAKTLCLTPEDSNLSIKAEKKGTAVFSGSRRIGNWKKEEGGNFWYADMPEAAQGKIYFRSLYVNGKLAKRAKLPKGDKVLEHLSKWNVRWMSSIGNGWERNPSKLELSRLNYKKGDVPATLDCASADIRVYHMWDDSIVRAASNDTVNSMLYFKTISRFPPGAFGKQGYVIYNTREGMLEEGSWYLDCTKGRLVYWPCAGEDMTKVNVEIPVTETVLFIAGIQNKKRISNVTIEGITVRDTKPPTMNASFGGVGINAAVHCNDATNVVFKGVDIINAGGIGINIARTFGFNFEDGNIINAGSCALNFRESRNAVIARNNILHPGRVFSSACAMTISGSYVNVLNNVIDDVPYSGICFGGGQYHLYEGNKVSRVMRLLHDGAAFYGGLCTYKCIIRNNIVSDISPNGSGYGCSAFYFDEGSRMGLVESNKTFGVALPIHNHMARHITVRDNVFTSTNTGIRVSYARCRYGKVMNNTFVTDKEVVISNPLALSVWENNVQVTGKGASQTVKSVECVRPIKGLPRKDFLDVPETSIEPAIDGTFNEAAWPGLWKSIDRDVNDLKFETPPHWIRAARKGDRLYIAIRIALFAHEKIVENAPGVAGDGVEFNFPNHKVVIYGDGTCKGADQFYGGYEKKGKGKKLFYAFSIPFSKIGVKGDLKANQTIPFNCKVYRGEFNETLYWQSPNENTVLTGEMKIK